MRPFYTCAALQNKVSLFSYFNEWQKPLILCIVLKSRACVVLLIYIKHILIPDKLIRIRQPK